MDHVAANLKGVLHLPAAPASLFHYYTTFSLKPALRTNMVASKREAEAQVRSWGFGHVFTWSDGPYVDKDCNTIGLG